MTEPLITRLRKRAEIRRQIPGRKSVQEGASDRIADLLDEAAAEIERLHYICDVAWAKKHFDWGDERRPIYDSYGQFTETWR